jgi:hypothetical protein
MHEVTAPFMNVSHIQRGIPGAGYRMTIPSNNREHVRAAHSSFPLTLFSDELFNTQRIKFQFSTAAECFNMC